MVSTDGSTNSSKVSKKVRKDYKTNRGCDIIIVTVLVLSQRSLALTVMSPNHEV